MIWKTNEIQHEVAPETRILVTRDYPAEPRKPRTAGATMQSENMSGEKSE